MQKPWSACRWSSWNCPANCRLHDISIILKFLLLSL
jgi:hypothetical protein